MRIIHFLCLTRSKSQTLRSTTIISLFLLNVLEKATSSILHIFIISILPCVVQYGRLVGRDGFCLSTYKYEIYQCPQKMNSMNGKCNFSFQETSNLKVIPAFWIASILCSFCIACSPDTVLIIANFNNSIKIARVEFTIEKYLWLIYLRELMQSMLRDIRKFCRRIGSK